MARGHRGRNPMTVRRNRSLSKIEEMLLDNDYAIQRVNGSIELLMDPKECVEFALLKCEVDMRIKKEAERKEQKLEEKRKLSEKKRKEIANKNKAKRKAKKLNKNK